jgi:hypothetical protein
MLGFLSDAGNHHLEDNNGGTDKVDTIETIIACAEKQREATASGTIHFRRRG